MIDKSSWQALLTSLAGDQKGTEGADSKENGTRREVFGLKTTGENLTLRQVTSMGGNAF